MNVDDGKHFDIGVVIGRFQVPDLHDAHYELIETVRKRHKSVLVLVGQSAAIGTKENPLPYVLRAQMIQSAFPGVFISPLLDMPNDEDWSQQVDRLVRTHFQHGTVRIYGGRGSFIPHYTGAFPTFEFPLRTTGDGTAVRKDVGRSYENDPMFRKGVIWASQNQWPKVWPTVDIAIINRDDEPVILMGARTAKGRLRLPGGFVDPTDESFEMAARREMREETGFVAEHKLEYYGTFPINDWRYRTMDQRIITTLFRTEMAWGSPHPSDEFSFLEWVKIFATPIDRIEESHRVLFEHIQKKEGEPRAYQYPVAH